MAVLGATGELVVRSMAVLGATWMHGYAAERAAGCSSQHPGLGSLFQLSRICPEPRVGFGGPMCEGVQQSPALGGGDGYNTGGPVTLAPLSWHYYMFNIDPVAISHRWVAWKVQDQSSSPAFGPESVWPQV